MSAQKVTGVNVDDYLVILMSCSHSETLSEKKMKTNNKVYLEVKKQYKKRGALYIAWNRPDPKNRVELQRFYGQIGDRYVESIVKMLKTSRWKGGPADEVVILPGKYTRAPETHWEKSRRVPGAALIVKHRHQVKMA